MLRSVLCASFVLALSVGARPAQAVPVDSVLSGQDGNFRYSYIHTSTSGSDGQGGTIIGSVGLGGAGGDWSVVGDIATLTIELTVNAGGNVSTYDAVGDFSVSALGEFATQADVLLGYLAFTLTSGADETAIDGLTFYFENRNYGTASDPPNGLEFAATGDELTLWGATNYTGTPVIGQPFDLTVGGRGIDLRVKMAPPIPEPGAKPLYLTGLAVIGFGASRLRKR